MRGAGGWLYACLAMVFLSLQGCDGAVAAADVGDVPDAVVSDDGDVPGGVDPGPETELPGTDSAPGDPGTPPDEAPTDSLPPDDSVASDDSATDASIDPAPLGGPCGAAGDCASGMCATGWPGGYCIAECDGQACPDNGVCTNTSSGPTCWKPCASHDDCREGYACTPSEQPHCIPRGETPIYGACAHSGNCDGILCFHLSCGADYHVCQIGTCTLACSDATPCPGDGKCADLGAGFQYCFLPCESDWDCEITETCSTAPNGKFCRPNSL